MKKLKVITDELPIEIMSTMGCRTQNGADANAINSYYKNIQSVINNGVLYDDVISASQKDGRGNICPVTIIMPTIAMEAVHYYDDKPCGDIENDTIDFFMQLLDEAIHDAKDTLIERFDYICSQSPESARFMYENNTMAGYVPEEGIISALKHGTLAIGQLGLQKHYKFL